MLSPCNPGAAVLLVMWARVGKNPRYVLYVKVNIFRKSPTSGKIANLPP
jgi:hypothetical protein